MTSHAEDFDVGKAVFEQLKELSAERQERVLRWVAEGLGVSLVDASGRLPPAAMPANAQAQFGSKSDIKTFVAAKDPRSDNQFAATVAYFYRFEASPAERRDSIDATALQEAARLSGRKRLGSPKSTLNNAKAAGYLDGISRGAFSINSVGENLVAMTLPGGGEAKTRPTRKSKSRVKKKTPSRNVRGKKG